MVGFRPGIHLSIFKSPVAPTKYLCLDCGYIEEWIDNDLYLKMIKEKNASTGHS